MATTGEALPAESVYNSPEVIRVLFAMSEYVSIDTVKEPLCNVGKPWIDIEDV